MIMSRKICYGKTLHEAQRHFSKETGRKMTAKTKKSSAVTQKGDIDELEKKFNNILLKAVDEAFETFGASVKKALYFHLERAFSVERETICKNPSEFSDGLERIFGLGAKIIEKLIIENVCNKTGCRLRIDPQKCSFVENLEKIKEKFIGNNKD